MRAIKPIQVGAQVKSLDDMDALRAMSADIGEVFIGEKATREYWRKADLSARSCQNLRLLAHGPSEGAPDDIVNLRSRYLTELCESVDLAHYKGIRRLTIHLWIDSRFISKRTISEKLLMLRELTNYAKERGVVISLENLSERAEDLLAAVRVAPDLRLTLDVGHGQLLSKVNRSIEILERLVGFVVELHVHDNLGGTGPTDDLHLPVGEGVIDFQSVFDKAAERGFLGDVVAEVGLDDLPESMNKIRSMWALANDKYS